MDDGSSPRLSRCLREVQFELSVLTGTKRIFGREAASHTAAASLASFLPPRPSMRYGVTKLAEMSLASSPSAISLRPQWCAPEHASIATRHPGGSCAHQAMNLSRANALHVTTWPCASIAYTWITRLARSTPTRTIIPRVTSLMDFPFSDSD